MPQSPGSPALHLKGSMLLVPVPQNTMARCCSLRPHSWVLLALGLLPQ